VCDDGTKLILIFLEVALALGADDDTDADVGRRDRAGATYRKFFGEIKSPEKNFERNY